VRYQKGGRGRGGMDCAGPLLYVARKHGIKLPDWMGYDAQRPDPAELYRRLRESLDEYPIEDAGEGRVGLCSWSIDNPEQQVLGRHLVFMVGARADSAGIVHVDATWPSRGVVASPPSWLSNRLLAVFRLRGVEYGPAWHC